MKKFFDFLKKVVDFKPWFFYTTPKHKKTADLCGIDRFRNQVPLWLEESGGTAGGCRKKKIPRFRGMTFIFRGARYCGMTEVRDNLTAPL
ncbi:MAG: hypothetical protein J5714_00145 [Alphaproteobacteria bacterium]|nr:hypothetical protein [Alphaproteobacteria bacterium]